ncbi:MAG: tyrosine--tRNA ligase [Patescibacteria group bacterium]|jgi:tyrosyl-tRNA synthetase
MPKITINQEKIQELLTRGVDEVINLEHLKKRLLAGECLRIKLGIDPTSPNIHLGRSIPLLKLKDFQELGHQIVFIVGDFTGVIGDTSDKDSERPMLTSEVIKKNMKDYAKQAGKIIDLKKCEVHYNSKWLKKLTYDKIGEQADQFSVAEFIARDNIKKRLNEGKRVSLREVLYPLMQGYDSVMVKAGVELGGTDQRFNLLAGRKLQENAKPKQEAQDIIMTSLIEGLDGRKMSSSWGNVINLTDKPKDMLGKVMRVDDGLIIKYFILTTRIPMIEINSYEKQLTSGTNPKIIKEKLGYEVVRMYYGEKIANKTLLDFNKKYRDKESPDDIEKLISENANETIIDYLVKEGIIGSQNKIIPSRSQFKRLIDAGAVKVNNNTMLSHYATIRDLMTQDAEIVLKIGKFSDYIIKVNLKNREVSQTYKTKYQDNLDIEQAKTDVFNYVEVDNDEIHEEQNIYKTKSNLFY